jgi:hypothetical protein
VLSTWRSNDEHDRGSGREQRAVAELLIAVALVALVVCLATDALA